MQKITKKIQKNIILILTLVIFLLPLTSFALGQIQTKPAKSISASGADLYGYLPNNSYDFRNAKIHFTYSTTNTKDNKCKTLENDKNTKKTTPFGINYTDFFQTVSGLNPDTTYYFCAVAISGHFVSSGGGGVFGNNSTWVNDYSYGDILSFKTIKSGSSGPKNKQSPSSIGDVTTYAVPSKDILDVTAIFHGSVTSTLGEAFAYFRYTSRVPQPPLFCNQIYGSDQQNITASTPPNGLLSGNSQSAKEALDQAILNLQKVKDEQNILVKAAYKKYLNSPPIVAVRTSGDPKAQAPIITGDYTKGVEGNIFITVEKGSGKFIPFSYTGLVSGNGTIDTPKELYNTGLVLEFYSFQYLSGSTWQISIPNKNSSSYLANFNAYNQAVDTQKKAIASAEADVALKQKIYDATLSGLNGAHFYAQPQGLEPDTTYYYCAVVSNSAYNPTIIKYGEVQKFHTAPCLTCDKTTIETKEASKIYSKSAVLNGTYSSTVGVDTYFTYKETADTTWKTTKINSHLAKTFGDISEVVTGLKPNTEYEFRAIADTQTTGILQNPNTHFASYTGAVFTFKTNAGSIFDGVGLDDDSDPNNPGSGPGSGDVIKGDPYLGCEPNCGNKGTGNKGDNSGPECEPNCGIPALPTCSDGIQNNDETGIDTGGICGDELPPTCDDGIKNGDETGVDSGGHCTKIPPPLPHCKDGIKNQDETDIDVGGVCGYPPPSCYDGIKNGDETDIDEGGHCGNGNGGTITIDGGTTTTSGGTTTISGGTTTTSGGTTTISGSSGANNGSALTSTGGTVSNNDGTTIINGGTTTITGGTSTIAGGTGTFNGGTVSNTGGTVTTSNGKTTIVGGTTTITTIDANGNKKVTTITGGTLTNNNGIISNVGGTVTTLGGTTTIKTGLGNNLSDINNNRLKNLKVGDTATPYDDDIVRYHEGIETVFTRRIMRDRNLARTYGYVNGTNLQQFAWDLAHKFAKQYFGYINQDNKEVRVSKPDVSAYSLRQDGSRIYVYEFYKGKIIDIREATNSFKTKNPYEYYYTRKF